MQQREIRRLRAHIALLESGSTDTSREVMRQKKAKTLNAPSADLANMECTHLVSSRRSPSSKGSEHVDVHVNQRGRVGFEECPTTSAVNSLRDALYGLRGVRVGEASPSRPTGIDCQGVRGQLEGKRFRQWPRHWVPPPREDSGTASVAPQRRRFADCWQWDRTNVNGHTSALCESFLATHRGSR